MSGAAAHSCLRMALNDAWAKARVFGALAALPPGAFTAPASLFIPSLCRTLNHFHEVDLYDVDARAAAPRRLDEFHLDCDRHPSAEACVA